MKLPGFALAWCFPVLSGSNKKQQKHPFARAAQTFRGSAGTDPMALLKDLKVQSPGLA